MSIRQSSATQSAFPTPQMPGVPCVLGCENAHVECAERVRREEAANTLGSRFRASRLCVFRSPLPFTERGAMQDCHGPIGTEEAVSDRLNAVKMAFCQPCHVKTGAKTGCNTCHDPR